MVDSLESYFYEFRRLFISTINHLTKVFPTTTIHTFVAGFSQQNFYILIISKEKLSGIIKNYD